MPSSKSGMKTPKTSTPSRTSWIFSHHKACRRSWRGVQERTDVLAAFSADGVCARSGEDVRLHFDILGVVHPRDAFVVTAEPLCLLAGEPMRGPLRCLDSFHERDLTTKLPYRFTVADRRHRRRISGHTGVQQRLHLSHEAAREHGLYAAVDALVQLLARDFYTEQQELEVRFAFRLPGTHRDARVLEHLQGAHNAPDIESIDTLGRKRVDLGQAGVKRE